MFRFVVERIDGVVDGPIVLREERLQRRRKRPQLDGRIDGRPAAQCRIFAATGARYQILVGRGADADAFRDVGDDRCQWRFGR